MNILEAREQKGYEEGYKIGLELGRNEQFYKKVALNMLRKGYKKEDISDITGFSNKELAELVKKIRTD